MPRSTRKVKLSFLPEISATFNGLHRWHKDMFEKLGWMVLAKAKGMDYKITVYKKCINNLINSIKHVSAEYKDPDRKHDLNVLLMQVECLKDTVSKMF
jgi:hypothetical protein